MGMKDDVNIPFQFGRVSISDNIDFDNTSGRDEIKGSGIQINFTRCILRALSAGTRRDQRIYGRRRYQLGELTSASFFPGHLVIRL